jgi:MFS transporter, DHA2 family, multidrug resistance protein
VKFSRQWQRWWDADDATHVFSGVRLHQNKRSPAAKSRREVMGNATSIFNLMRNLDGSIGIAAVTTLVARHEQINQNNLVGDVSVGRLRVEAMVQALRSWFVYRGADAATATRRAYDALSRMVQQQAAMLSFNQVFWLMDVVLVDAAAVLF